MKHVYEIDVEGYFVRDVLLQDEEELSSNCIDTPLPHGMFSPKYVEGAWVNDISDGEIDFLMGRDLPTLKVQKDAELNAACNKAILSGFTHEINGITYWFSYDMEAQGNFRDAKEMLSDGVVTEIPWTVRLGKDGIYSRVPITLDTIKEIALVIMHHKTEKISKYRDFLLPIVNSATTVEEVQAVVW